MGSWRCTAAGVAPGVSGTVAGDAGTVTNADGTVACAGTTFSVLSPRESAVAGGSSSWLSHSATAMMATKTSSPLTTSNRKSHTFFMLYPCMPIARPPATITFIRGVRPITLPPDVRPDARFHGKEMDSPA